MPERNLCVEWCKETPKCQFYWFDSNGCKLWALKNGTEVKEITDGVYKVPNPGPLLAWGAIGVVCPGTPQHNISPTTATPTPPPTGKCNDEEWTNHWGFGGTPPEGMRELSKDTGVTDKDVCKKKCKDIKKCQFYVLSFDNGYNVPGCKLYALKDGANLNKIIEGVHSDMVMFMKEDVAGVVCQGPPGTEAPSTEPPATTEPSATAPPAAPTTAAATEAPTTKAAQPSAEDCKEQEWTDYHGFVGTDKGTPDGMRQLSKDHDVTDKDVCKKKCKDVKMCQFYILNPYGCKLYALKDGADVDTIRKAADKNYDTDSDDGFAFDADSVAGVVCQ